MIATNQKLGLHRNAFNNTIRAYVLSFTYSNDLTVKAQRAKMRRQAASAMETFGNKLQLEILSELIEEIRLYRDMFGKWIPKPIADEMFLKCQA